MIDTSKYDGRPHGSLVHSISNEEWKKLSPASQALVEDAPLLLAEVKRLQKENNRYLEFICWLGLEHEGKKLVQEYGDEELVELIE